MSEDIPVKRLQRHYEWFHHANSALAQVKTCDSNEFPNFWLKWMKFGLSYLQPLAAELQNPRLIEETQWLESFLAKLSKKDIVQAKSRSWGRFGFGGELEIALLTARRVLRMSPQTWDPKETIPIRE